MKMPKTIADLKRLKTVKAERVFTGKWHKGNVDEFIAKFTEDIKNHYGEEESKKVKLEHNKTSISFGNRVAMIPNLDKKITGTLEIRSNDYIFWPDNGTAKDGSYGPKLTKEEVTMTEYGFSIQTFSGGELQYHLKLEN